MGTAIAHSAYTQSKDTQTLCKLYYLQAVICIGLCLLYSDHEAKNQLHALTHEQIQHDILLVHACMYMYACQYYCLRFRI